MDRRAFDQEMMRAKAMAQREDRRDYWQGYRWGLMRRYFGEAFAAEEQHNLWMRFAEDPDQQKAEQGRGYKDAIQLRWVKS